MLRVCYIRVAPLYPLCVFKRQIFGFQRQVFGLQLSCVLQATRLGLFKVASRTESRENAPRGGVFVNQMGSEVFSADGQGHRWGINNPGEGRTFFLDVRPLP